MNFQPDSAAMHSPAWVAFTQVNFALTLGAMTFAIWAMEADIWIRAFMGLGPVSYTHLTLPTILLV